MCVLVLESSVLGLWWKYLLGVYVEWYCAKMFFVKIPTKFTLKPKILFLLLKTFNLFLLSNITKGNYLVNCLFASMRNFPL